MLSTVCFTGRRPKDLCGYHSHASYQPLVNHITSICETYYHKGVRQFISGGAQGFDQLAFWAVNNLRNKYPDIENIVYVPFKGQERNWLEQGLFSQEEYNKMINKYATSVVYLQDKLYDTQSIFKALHARNHAMVDASDVVIALYPSDEWTFSKGGTAECMRYADKQNKHIEQIKYTISNNMVMPV